MKYRIVEDKTIFLREQVFRVEKYISHRSAWDCIGKFNNSTVAKIFLDEIKKGVRDLDGKWVIEEVDVK